MKASGGNIFFIRLNLDPYNDTDKKMNSDKLPLLLERYGNNPEHEHHVTMQRATSPSHFFGAGVCIFLFILGGCTTPSADLTAKPVLPPAIDCPSPAPRLPPNAPLITKCPASIRTCPLCGTSHLTGRFIIGERERITIEPQGIRYNARIDTGASLTSVHAVNIVRFKRDGKPWIRFQLNHPKIEELLVLEKPFVRWAIVRETTKNTGAESDYRRRPVVMMTLSLGPVTRQVEVSLTDRSYLENPVLIGRNFLADTVLVDVSQRYTAGHTAQ